MSRLDAMMRALESAEQENKRERSKRNCRTSSTHTKGGTMNDTMTPEEFGKDVAEYWAEHGSQYDQIETGLRRVEYKDEVTDVWVYLNDGAYNSVTVTIHENGPNTVEDSINKTYLANGVENLFFMLRGKR